MSTSVGIPTRTSGSIGVRARHNSVIALKLKRDEQEIIARPDRIWARVKSTRSIARPSE